MDDVIIAERVREAILLKVFYIFLRYLHIKTNTYVFIYIQIGQRT